MIDIEQKENEMQDFMIDFGPVEDKTVDIIKVIGVGGGGCNAVRNMYNEGIAGVTFAVCNTDSKSLAGSPVPVKVPLGVTGLGAGANPDVGREAAEYSIEQIKKLLDDGTKLVFVTAGMGGGTGTGAAPVVANVAKSKGILTIGVVTIPFYFEKRKKIIKALKGVEEMRKNVDALLIINNERICDIYSDSGMSVKESFRRADEILANATRSISELITMEGDINLDFCDVETTMRGGGGAIMAIGRSSGEHRVGRALIDALDSPLLYGSDIGKAKRILINISTSENMPLMVKEMSEIDDFMNELHPNIDVIWGVSDYESLGEDAKVTILATGLEDDFLARNAYSDEEYYDKMISSLYKPYHRIEPLVENHEEPEVTPSADNIPFTITTGEEPEVAEYIATPAEDVYTAAPDDDDELPADEDKQPEQEPHIGYEHKPKVWGTFQDSFVSRAKALFKQMSELTQD